MDLLFLESTDTDDVLSELHNPAQYRGYLQTMSYFVSRYSWRNIFLIYSKLPHASMLADYSRWKEEHGRTIIRNSTGIKINAPVEQKPKTKLVAKLNPGTGEVMLDENGKKIMEEITITPPPKFMQRNLFDISQTEGNPTHRLAGDVLTDDSLHNVFVDVLVAMLPTSELLDEDSDMAFNIWKVVKHITHERLKNLDMTGINAFDFIVASVAFVVCRRFGVDADMAGLAPNDTGIADMLEIISKQASSLIAAIEDRLVFLCNERGLDPMTLHIAPEPTPPTPITESPATPAAEPPTEKPSDTEPQAETSQDETPLTQQTTPAEHDKQETEPPAPATTEELPPPQASTTPTATDTPTEQATTPPDLPEDKASIDVYRLSATDAAKHGAVEIYDLSRRVDVECAANISSGIQYFKDGSSYVLDTPAKVLLNEYGKNRMMWVLSKHIVAKRKRFTKDNLDWADALVNDGTGYGDDVPTFTIKTHPAVLDVFVTELRKILETKPSFSARMVSAKKRSEEHNNSSG